jgi:hypothetical protein
MEFAQTSARADRDTKAYVRERFEMPPSATLPVVDTTDRHSQKMPYADPLRHLRRLDATRLQTHRERLREMEQLSRNDALAADAMRHRALEEQAKQTRRRFEERIRLREELTLQSGAPLIYAEPELALESDEPIFVTPEEAQRVLDADLDFDKHFVCAARPAS